MNDNLEDEDREEGASSGRPRHRRGQHLPTGLLAMINTTLVGIGGVFLATASLPVTGIAAGTVALVAVIIVVSRR